jgi:hypothetical protein
MPMGDVMRLNNLRTGGSAMGIPGGGRAAGAQAREAMRISRLPPKPKAKPFWTKGKKRAGMLYGGALGVSTGVAMGISNSKSSAKGQGMMPGSETGIYGM